MEKPKDEPIVTKPSEPAKLGDLELTVSNAIVQAIPTVNSQLALLVSANELQAHQLIRLARIDKSLLNLDQKTITLELAKINQALSDDDNPASHFQPQFSIIGDHLYLLNASTVNKSSNVTDAYVLKLSIASNANLLAQQYVEFTIKPYHSLVDQQELFAIKLQHISPPENLSFEQPEDFSLLSRPLSTIAQESISITTEDDTSPAEIAYFFQFSMSLGTAIDIILEEHRNQPDVLVGTDGDDNSIFSGDPLTAAYGLAGSDFVGLLNENGKSYGGAGSDFILAEGEMFGDGPKDVGFNVALASNLPADASVNLQLNNIPVGVSFRFATVTDNPLGVDTELLLPNPPAFVDLGANENGLHTWSLNNVSFAQLDALLDTLVMRLAPEINDIFTLSLQISVDNFNVTNNIVVNLDSSDQDQFFLSGDNTTAYGGWGDDDFTASHNAGENLTIYAGAGDDIISDSFSTNASYIDGGSGNDHIQGRNGRDILLGGDGDDEIFGEKDSREGGTITGTPQDQDTIFGGAGNDYIEGSNGDDIIYGGSGDDIMYGGNSVLSTDSHNDTFVWQADDAGSIGAPSIDIIKDFGRGRDGFPTLDIDKLDLSDLLDYQDGDDLTQFLSFEYSDNAANTGLTGTTLKIKPNATDVTQIIVLDDVDLTANNSLTTQQIIDDLGANLIVTDS